ncbi:uncharacterized protein [Henckelia pumila]|uniref:uncharacterized protein isoform X2 n=1 Tax=Henckelia pumila TaxID=405737 RepID=UPI003C6E5B15
MNLRSDMYSRDFANEISCRTWGATNCVILPILLLLVSSMNFLVPEICRLKLEKRKNFKFENICKMRKINLFYCMTLRALDAETDECRLFRCVVYALCDRVMLCEIPFQPCLEIFRRAATANGHEQLPVQIQLVLVSFLNDFRLVPAWLLPIFVD